MYKLWTDKEELFKCKITLEGASLSNATSRIILENNSKNNLMFYGKIDSKGNCSVPIKALKGILDERDSGRIKLEVIADDTYFNPWSTNYVVDTVKKVKVEVISQSIKSKPKKMIVSEIKETNEYGSIIKYLKEHNITKKNILKHKKRLMPSLKIYFNKVGIKDHTKALVEIVKAL